MQTETIIRLGKIALYSVIPPAWGSAVAEVVELVANNYRERRAGQALIDVGPDRQPGRDAAPSLFLREEYEIVGFLGREDELKTLTEWALAGERTVSVALMTGGPGRGKSRLARRLCHLAKDWNSGTWMAGPLDAGNLTDPEHFRPLMALPGPLLLVVDYAERRTAQVKALVAAALRAERGGHPVRILLIAREEGEWWLALDGEFADRLDNPFEPGRVTRLRLGPIEGDPAVENRRAEFERALEAFQKALGADASETPVSVPDDLSRAEEPEALDIHIAALLAAYGDDRVMEAGSYEEQLLDRLVKREQKGWDRAIEAADISDQGLQGAGIRRAMAWLATTDGLTSESDAAERLHLLPDFQDAPDLVRRGVARIAHDFYPGGEGAWWGGVGPDRLTTWLTRELDDAVAETPPAVARLPEIALVNLLRHLTWRAQRYSGERSEQALAAAIRAGGKQAIATAADLGPEIGDPVGSVAANVLSETPDADTARVVYDRVGESTVSLRELAAAATAILRDNTTDDAERAIYANNLSNRLSALGRREAALAAVEEAVAIRRGLADTRPDAFRPDLAGSLNNLGIRLSDLGRREAALAVVEEAVKLYRGLADARPDAFRPDLAMSLNNLSNRLSALGRREAALAAVEEAVAILRELADARPDAFRPDLAGSLNNLSNRLSALGRREAALAAVEEAVKLYRGLADARPDAFRPDLAMSLNNLSNHLSDLGRREAALTAVEEAVKLYRGLADARPDAFRPDLAMSLNNLSNCLSDLGRREAALAAVEEAVAIRRELAAARPDAFRPDLAGSLGNLSNCLSDLGRREAALAAVEEAAVIWRELADAQSDAFRPDLAGSLNNLSNRLSDLGRREAALAAVEDAVKLYRGLADARPDAFRPDLAGSLGNLSNCLSALGRREAALAPVEEAAVIWRELADAQSDAFRPDLAGSLNNLSNRLSDLGRREAALAAVEDAVKLYRGLADARPDAFRPDLASSLGVKGLILLEQRNESAIAVFREGMEVLAEQFFALPDAHGEKMAALVGDYRHACGAFGVEPDDALLAAMPTNGSA